MPDKRSISRRLRLRYVVPAAIAVVIGASVPAIVGGPDDYLPPVQSGDQGDLLWFYAPRDIGALPGPGSWCTGATRCYTLQESSGDAVDGSGSGHDLTPQNAPRQGVLTGLPVTVSGSVDLDTEKATWIDGHAASTKYFKRATTAQAATNLVSIVAVINATKRRAENRILYAHTTADADLYGYRVGIDTSGKLFATIKTTLGATTITSTSAIDDLAWHCVRFDIDARMANAGKIWVDGANDTAGSGNLQSTATFDATGTISLGARYDGTLQWPGGVARISVSDNALSSDAKCGRLWRAPATGLTKVLSADSTWTHSGAMRCYSASATRAVCVPGGKPGVHYSAPLVASGRSGISLPIDDRLQCHEYTRYPGGGGWQRSSATAVDDSAVAPDGSLTATVMTFAAGGYIYAYNYSACAGAGAPVYPSVWLRCQDTGATIVFQNKQGAAYGKWTIDCATVGTSWKLYSKQSCPGSGCTVNNAWIGDPTGLASEIIVGTPAGKVIEHWLGTISPDPGNSVIYSETGRTDTGAPLWAIDNALKRYYHGKRGIMQAIGNWIAGQCLDVRASVGDVGRIGGDAVDYWQHNSAGAKAWQCDAALSGVKDLLVRWDSTKEISGGEHAKCAIDSVAQAWDIAPAAPWTEATPAIIDLTGYGVTTCTADLQTVKIGGAP